MIASLSTRPVIVLALGLIVAILLAGSLYFLPTIIGAARKVVNVGSVFVINLLLGWTLIGWAVALAMALRTNPPYAYPHYLQQHAQGQLPSPVAQRDSGKGWRFGLLSAMVALVGVLVVVGAIIGASAIHRSNGSSSTTPLFLEPTTSPVNAAAISSCEADAKSVETAVEAYKAQIGSYPPDLSTLTVGQTVTENEGTNQIVGPWLRSAPTTDHYTIFIDGTTGDVYVYPAYAAQPPTYDDQHNFDLRASSGLDPCVEFAS